MKKNSYLLIFVITAMLVCLMFNFRVLTHFLDLLDRKSLDSFSLRQMAKFKFLILNVSLNFGLFVFFSFSNFFLFPKLQSFVESRLLRIMLISLFNLLLFFVILSIYRSISIELNLDSKRFYRRFFMFYNCIIVIFAIVQAFYVLLIQKIKTSEHENILIKEERSKAELSALKDQISPHFFFNTLSTLSNIVRNENKEQVLEFIQYMSKIYRYTLSKGNDSLVYVEEEIIFVKSYAFLLNKRFGDKLHFDIDLPLHIMNSKIPPMSLQLLIENAINHNVITAKKPLCVYVYYDNGFVCVENNLQEKKYVNSFGIGLKNLSNRYVLLLGKDIVIDKQESCFKVKIPIL